MLPLWWWLSLESIPRSRPGRASTSRSVCLSIKVQKPPIPSFDGHSTDESEDLLAFHSHTLMLKSDQGTEVLRAQGGRVISVCGLGRTRNIAATTAYSGIAGVYFEGIDYRRDLVPAQKNSQDSFLTSGVPKG
ncbi:hypothetical protein FCULG_00006805 [Fusarium culmorum]|uniref:Phosphoribosylglycinamide synthetase C-domain domain-containing protein n=1 Tax=Fusarium culmorum TaxID=5516 RepID=A0A2T4GSP6_FUSCU|nr:hypothetical protein FCULG_00006805 [Fusarium culmorum]